MTEKALRWYQKDAVTHIVNAVKDPECHPVAAIPTGAGKTLIICELINEYIDKNHQAKILVLSHVKEILEQNYDELVDYYGETFIGLYSAGLEQRVIKQITVAGIQSIYNKDYHDWDLIIIDECHLVTIKQEGMYRSFLNNVDANFVGLTATPFRLGHGYLHRGKGALFNNLCFDLTSADNFNRLVEEGFLTRLITKGTIERLDKDGLGIRANDYIPKEMSERYDQKPLNEAIVDEIIEYGQNYKKWLIFAIDIDHAENITKILINRGIPSLCVHSKMEDDRGDTVFQFKRGDKFRAMVNVNILTTGFDVPSIDLIAMIRPTKSPVLHVQAIGRGLRVAPEKDHCLVLDFAGNTSELGPINDVLVKTNAYEKTGQGDAPVKECPSCMAMIHAKMKNCDVCGHLFEFKSNLEATASSAEVVRTSQPSWFNIDGVKYNIHRKFGKPDSLKATYIVGAKTVSEWVCLEHGGYASHKARNWVKFRWKGQMPRNTQELYALADRLAKPLEIKTNLTERFPTVKDMVLEKQDDHRKQLDLFPRVRDK